MEMTGYFASFSKRFFWIKKGINQLKSFPYIGVKVERAPNLEIIRDLIIGNYTARYLIRPEEITMLRIWHHKEKENRL